MKFILPILLSILIFSSSAASAYDKAKVFLVVNSKSPDSLKIAEYYCGVRNIDKSNIITVSVDDKPELTRLEYQKYVANPIIENLIGRKAVSASVLSRNSSDERPQYVFLSHDVDFIILCRLPFKIAGRQGNKPSGSFDGASVDSELAATFLNMKSINGPCRNPLYKNFTQGNLDKVYGVLRVARLDGGDFATVKKIIDSAANAERKGLRGRAYIDKSQKYQAGDKWMSEAAEIIGGLYFDTSVDEKKELFDFSQRFDCPAIYFGWYTNFPKFYFSEKGFSFADGAIALHLFSFSAANLRREGWTHNFIENNAAQSFGNVYEPFLSGTQDIPSIMRAYLAGMNAGEAAYASISVLSWQSVAVGDPLYEPFKVSLDDQLRNIKKGEIDEMSQYAVLRQMNKLAVLNGDKSASLEFGESFVDKIPDTALLWRLAGEYKTVDAKKSLVYAEKLHARKIWLQTEYLGLAMELANFFEENSEPRKAMEIYSSIISRKDVSDVCKKAVTARAKIGAERHSLILPKNIAVLDAQFRRIEEEAAAKSRLDGKKK